MLCVELGFLYWLDVTTRHSQPQFPTNINMNLADWHHLSRLSRWNWPNATLLLRMGDNSPKEVKLQKNIVVRGWMVKILFVVELRWDPMPIRYKNLPSHIVPSPGFELGSGNGIFASIIEPQSQGLCSVKTRAGATIRQSRWLPRARGKVF